jgi:integrase
MPTSQLPWKSHHILAGWPGNAWTSAGVPNLRLHDFRRSAASGLLRAGINRDVAKKITGHKTDSMFSWYNIVTEDDLMEAADNLNARRTTGANGGQQSQTTEISPQLAPASAKNS